MQLRSKIPMKNVKRIPLQKLLWCKIRYYQQLHDISNELLAKTLGVSKRTLSEYDKDSCNITLEKVDRFLYANNITIDKLMNE